MMTLVATTILMISYLSTSCANPVKLTALMLVFGTLSCLYMALTTGKTWFPLVFFMLFVGGILIMFMILSSAAPNEMALKFKLSYMLTILIWVMSNNVQMNLLLEAYSMKMMYQNGWFLPIMLTAILSYFFAFLSMISLSDASMKTTKC